MCSSDLVDVACNAWDLAPAQILIPEAGGRCITLPEHDGKIGAIFGSPALVEQLERFFGS